MKKIQLLALACLSSISLTISLAHAGTRANTFTLMEGGGGYFFDSKRELDNSGILFGGAGYNFTEHWGIEGLFGFMEMKTHEPGERGEWADGALYVVDAVYHFSSYYFVEPFVMMGIGMTSLEPNNHDALDEGNINAGLGLQFFVDKAVSFKVEARDFYTMVGGKNDVMVDGSLNFAFNLC